jgi:indolepyruvate ferredoxin oxidoreductase, beta subunit
VKTTRLIIVAVGGQGNLLASKVLGEAALDSGIPVRMSEIHGMAQRGGVVESSMVFGDAQSTIISDGQADVLVGFEPCETLRALNKCNPDSVVITNLSPLPPFTVTTGQGVYPDIEAIQTLIGNKTRRLIALHAVDLAQKAGNTMAVNMVLLGALIRTEIVPVSEAAVKKAISTKTRKEFAATNLKAFDLGFEAALQCFANSP